MDQKLTLMNEFVILIQDVPYLLSRYELQWPQRTPHVCSVGLEIVDGAGNTCFKLRWMLSRRARQ